MELAESVFGKQFVQFSVHLELRQRIEAANMPVADEYLRYRPAAAESLHLGKALRIGRD
jgi:hypothetical protein